MSASRMTAAVAAALCAGAVFAAELPPPAAAAPVPDGAAVAAHHVSPQYPKKALKQKVDGCVALSFLLDAEGRASDFQVVESLPQGVFDAATLKVMDQWRFQPPRRAGRYAQLVQFRLGSRAPVNVCAPLPSFAALNPGAPPLAREIRILQRVMPDFRAMGEAADGGCVTVRFQVRHDGFVGDVQVLDARPKSLAEPAVAAMKQWVFSSFPPPDLYATQTFNYTPEQVRMPDNVLRASYATLSEDGALGSAGCGAPVKKP